MAKPVSRSFRRILLSRLLLLSVPIILVGVTATYVVTYRKARSALLETARQNLTESASRKAQRIEDAIASLKNNLVAASEHPFLSENLTPNNRVYLEHLRQTLPTQIRCLQLVEIDTQTVTSSTCQPQPLGQFDPTFWSEEQTSLFLTPNQVQVQVILPNTEQEGGQATSSITPASQLHLLLATPVYNANNQLSHLLFVKTEVIEPTTLQPGSLSGYPVIINEDGTILAHPLSDRVGRNIAQEDDAERLQSILRNALAGRQDFLHLFSFEKNGVELLSGYSAIPSPLPQEQGQQWAILSITRLDNALATLDEIRRILLTFLLTLTFVLIIATVAATLYMAREMALPLEKIRDYAFTQDHLHSQDSIPSDFTIYEFRQLGIAFNNMLEQLRHRAEELEKANELNNHRAEELEVANQQLEIANELNNNMIERLKTWAKELETAWQEAQTANRLKTEFLRITSHELRTPLNGIINSLEFVTDDLCDSKEEELDWLGTAQQSAVHLLGIMDEIADISKMETGQLSVHIEAVELSKVLQDAISLYHPQMEAKGLELDCQEWEEELVVHADPSRLRQVFLYILDNAVKFTKAGSIYIRTYAEYVIIPDPENPELPSSASGQQAVITIQDTGIGIDPKEQQKLFKPFVLVDGTTTRESGGIGLGLAISRQLMDLMEGEITLFSEGENEGTTVKITLPMAKMSSLVIQSSVKKEG
ncbi:ATP-binding protein [Spirulina sp. CS-785/01]|uniref:hybrid sensor histidine kinase/response regulator n=1 Tax=Spirulina sp. CS-785/01 TaxID=3021716 RepID=UPI00232B4BE6|nr:hybrid sensor histidine kinase/response regulator [Spirulina sp. CS-785/01]MDB9312127.1 ATP-binding protein [Spirulina sp. CS-785/01]